MMISKKFGAALLLLVFALVSAAGRARGQDPNPSAQGTASEPQSQIEGRKDPKSHQILESNAEARRQAYVRFIEARGLKEDIQRLRNPVARMLDDSIKKAVAAYKETIQLDPTAADPHIDLGELYFFVLGQKDLAEAEALEAIKLEPDYVEAHQLLARLRVYAVKLDHSWRKDLVENAVSAYEKVAELDPGNAEAWAMLAELYRGNNETNKQIHALEKWTVARIPSDTLFFNSVMNNDLSADQAYFQLSRLYLNKGNNKEAVIAASRAYASDPDSNDYARNLISVLRLGCAIDEELVIYSNLMKTAPSPALMVGYGSALIRSGGYSMAIEILHEYVAQDPSNASAVGLLAIAQRRANQRSAAIETLKAGTAKADEASRPDLMLELAQTYEEAGRNEEAIAQYEQVFDELSNNAPQSAANSAMFGEVVNRMVRVLRRSGSKEQLQSVLTKTRRVIDDSNPLLDLITIESMREDGKFREALEIARAASRRHPDDRALKFDEAVILGESKLFKESVDLLRSMIKGNAENATDDSSVYIVIAGVQMQAGQLDEAQASARKGLELNPEDPQALIQLSSILDHAGKREASEKTLRELLKREPDNATALNNLGYLMVERGDGYSEALKLIEKAVAIDPLEGNFLDSLGWTHFKLGNIEKARQYLEKAIIYSTRNSTAHEHLGDVLREAGQLSEARKQWEKALEYSIEADEITRLRGKLKNSH